MPECVIVTGGAGFIGSHVVDAAIDSGRRVVVVDDLSTGDARRVNPQADLETVDITDVALLAQVFDRARPSAVYHLAAQSSVTVSVSDPSRDCAVNVLGTLNVLQAAGRHRAPLVFTSTGGALYGNDAEIPTSEDAPPAPLAPYGASKWSGEAYVRTWALASGIPHVVCRLGNVYGPRQSPHGEAGVVSIFSHRLWKGEAPVLFGHGAPTRDYIHVADVAAALLAATGQGGVYNIATGIETATSDLLQALQSVAGTAVFPELAPLRPGELERSCMSPRRAQARLHWNPETSLPQGLVTTYPALVSEFERDAAAGGH